MHVVRVLAHGYRVRLYCKACNPQVTGALHQDELPRRQLSYDIQSVFFYAEVIVDENSQPNGRGASPHGLTHYSISKFGTVSQKS